MTPWLLLGMLLTSLAGVLVGLAADLSQVEWVAVTVAIGYGAWALGPVWSVPSSAQNGAPPP